MLQCFENVVKHERDVNNPKFAHKIVAEKVIRKIHFKYLRNELRFELNKVLDKTFN